MATATATPARASAADDARLLEQRGDMILQQLRQLPTLPSIAVRLLELTASDESSAHEVVQLVESDPALTLKILRLAQRAHLGARNAATVQRAVLLLGFEHVRNAVLSIQTFEALGSATALSDLMIGLWRHALAAACVAQALAQRIPARPVQPEEAFVCGLLHDVGKIALAACLPKTYARVVRRTDADFLCICDVERELLGIDHTVAGRRLLMHWKMSRTIVECAWLHHHPADALPESVLSPAMVALIHLSDNVVRRAGVGYSGYQHISDVDALAAGLGLGSDMVSDVIAALPERMTPLADALGLEPVDPKAFVQAVSAANAELGRVNAALVDERHPLQSKARCFDALVHLATTSAPEDPPGRACALAAEAVAFVLESDAAIVTASPSAGQRHVGAWDGAQGSRSRVVASADPAPTDEARGSAVVPAMLGSCDAGDAAAWQLFFPGVDASTLTALPLVHQREVVGSAIVAVSPAARRRWLESARELSAFASAVAMSLRQSFAQFSAVRLQEQLSDANRRLQAAQSEVLRRRSLSMIAEMASGAAHELNNPLAIIAGRAQMLAQDCEDNEQERILGIISEQAKRASSIVSELMAFAKPEAPKPVPITLGSLLEMVWQRWTTQSSLRPDQLEVRATVPEIALLADPAAVMQVFDAILGNAVQATTPQSAHIIINSTSLPSDETVRIRVEDNGTGMSHEVLEHACDPFYSHRTAGRGRGLGLSKAQRLMDLNGGRLRLESRSGAGTTVHLEFLPATRAN